MYVFHDRRLNALERLAPPISITIERIVEATSFGSEPEEMIDCLGVATFARWLACCPDNPGVDQTRDSLRRRILRQSNPRLSSFDAVLSDAIRSGTLTVSLIEKTVQAEARQNGASLLTAIEAANSELICQVAEQLGAAWIGLSIHPQTIFNKMVGYVLDPDERSPETSSIERLLLICEDFAARIALRHQVSATIELGSGKRRRSPPSMGDVTVCAIDGEADRYRLSTSVNSRDPGTAAYMARAKFVETVQAWRSGAGELQVQIPSVLEVQMPDEIAVAIETRTFRLSRPRYEATPNWAMLDPAVDGNLISAGETISRAREEVTAGRITQGIATLWSATESLLRRSGETHISGHDLAVRLKATYLPYWIRRQFGLLGVYLDSAKATQPRVQSPVDPAALATRLAMPEFSSSIKGSRCYLRHRISELLLTQSQPDKLPNELESAAAKVEAALYAARTIRNIYVHCRVRIANESEEIYVYKWLETLLDVFLNSALGWRYMRRLSHDEHLGALPNQLAAFHRNVSANGTYGRLIPSISN